MFLPCPSVPSSVCRDNTERLVGWLVGWLVFNGTFGTKRHVKSKSLLKILISDKK